MDLERLVEGKNVPLSDNPFKPPAWFHKHKFERGSKFFIRNWAPVTTTQIMSILVHDFASPNILRTMTTFSHSARSAVEQPFPRSQMTFVAIALWHMENVFDETTEAHRNMRFVRQLHRDVIQYGKEQDSASLPFSQFDLALATLGMVGYLVLYPDQFGLSDDVSHDDLDDYVYWWRVVGYLLGADDKYNICQGTYHQSVDLFRDIDREIILKNIDQPPAEMFKEVADSFMSEMLPSLSRDVVLTYCRAAMRGDKQPDLSELPGEGRQLLILLRGYFIALRLDRHFLLEQNEVFSQAYKSKLREIEQFEAKTQRAQVLVDEAAAGVNAADLSFTGE